jgi:radical SAM superfamily enzyme YgiQ (UPF0313 family)
VEEFQAFARLFTRLSRQAGKKQYLVPYLIAGHPGSTLDSMVNVASFLHQAGYRPEQVQDFLPAPFDVATCMYYTGLDPITGKPVYVPKTGRERDLQRALLQYYEPRNYFRVREALEETGRTDLIGPDPQCLIPAQPPAGARRPGRRRPLRPGPPRPGAGYRPHRKTSGRRRKS